MGKRISGVAYIKADGRQLTLIGEFSAMLSEFEREGLVGPSGVVGYSEKPVVPFIEGEMVMTDETNIDEIEAMTDVTITIELANGQTGVLEQAWHLGGTEVDSESKFTAKFEGIKGHWA